MGDIPRIGPDEPIRSAANELETAHRSLDRIPGVKPREEAQDLATRIQSLDAIVMHEGELFGVLLQECVRIATGSSCENEMRELVRSIERGLGYAEDDLTSLDDAAGE